MVLRAAAICPSRLPIQEFKRPGVHTFPGSVCGMVRLRRGFDRMKSKAVSQRGARGQGCKRVPIDDAARQAVHESRTEGFRLRLSLCTLFQEWAVFVSFGDIPGRQGFDVFVRDTAFATVHESQSDVSFHHEQVQLPLCQRPGVTKYRFVRRVCICPFRLWRLHRRLLLRVGIDPDEDRPPLGFLPSPYRGRKHGGGWPRGSDFHSRVKYECHEVPDTRTFPAFAGLVPTRFFVGARFATVRDRGLV